MKNIHLITTNKPSRLQLQMNGKYHLENGQKISLKSYQNIYITSDRKAKKGDSVILPNGGMLKNIREWEVENYLKNGVDIKVIALATEEDLVSNGIQAIDDEFLEWFVKNSSCEFIETKLINFEIDMGLGDSCVEYGSYYEIIFPKEEPKSLNLKELESKLDNILENETKESLTDWLNSKKLQKQECEYLKRSSMDKEIEEAAEKYANKKGDL
jgi:hypothetical protein